MSPSSPPWPLYAGLFGGPPVTPYPVLRHSQDSGLSGGAGPGSKVPPLSSGVRRPPPSGPQAHNMDVITCSPSFPHCCGVPHDQIAPSVCQNTAGSGSPVSMQEARCMRRSTLSDAECPSLIPAGYLLPGGAGRLPHHCHHSDPVGILYENQFINSTMGKWCNQYTLINFFVTEAIDDM